MTPRKPANPDAITHAEAAEILGVARGVIPRLVREGLLHRVPGQHPSLSSPGTSGPIARLMSLTAGLEHQACWAQNYGEPARQVIRR